MPQLGKRKDYRLSTNKKFSVRERKRLLKHWTWESFKRMTYGLKTGYYLPSMLREELRKCEKAAQKTKKLWLKKVIDKITK
jgi:hypothetical protein